MIKVSIRFKRGGDEELGAAPRTLRRQASQPWRHGMRLSGRRKSRAQESGSGDLVGDRAAATEDYDDLLPGC